MLIIFVKKVLDSIMVQMYKSGSCLIDKGNCPVLGTPSYVVPRWTGKAQKKVNLEHANGVASLEVCRGEDLQRFL